MRFRLALILPAFGLAVLAIFLLLRAKPAHERIAGAVVPPAQRIEEQMRAAIQPTSETLASAPEDSPTEPQLAPKLELSRGKLLWEEKIERVIGAADLSDTAKARQLLAMLPALPEHGLATAAEEAVTRLPDADYNAVALPVVSNPQTHGLVEGVLFADLMERPDAVTLPALLRIAQIPHHPFAPYARDNLNLLLGEDFGANWTKWSEAVRKALEAASKGEAVPP